MTSPLTEAIVSTHTQTICSMAAKIARKFGMFSHFEDLVQEGMVAMLTAWRKFDDRQGTKFNTYLVWWVKSFMMQYVAENYSVVKIGRHFAFKKYGLSKDLELDAPVGTTAGEKEGFCYRDIILPNRDPGEETLDETLDRVFLQQKVRRELNDVAKGATQKAVVEYRLLTDPPETCKEVAARLGCTFQSVHLTEKRMMRRVEARIKGSFGRLYEKGEIL